MWGRPKPGLLPRTWVWAIFGIVGGAAAGSGCGTAADIEEIKTTQREILKRLAALEKNDQALLSSLRSGYVPREPDPHRVYDIPIGTSPVKGPEDAKVTVVHFLDYQCPFSKSSQELVREILAVYHNEVRLVVKQFPLAQLHRDARNAAKAALVAHNHGKFWQMHDLLFRKQRALDYESLRKYARAIGLDVMRFDADMASAEIEAELRADIADGHEVQVIGTPTFFVDGKRVTTRSFEAFKVLIDEGLSANTPGS